MRTRKDLRVIPGGKLVKAEPSADLHRLDDIPQLLGRVARYRHFLVHSPNDETASLVSDMEDAVNALGRLEQSLQPEARRRAAEYRHLIAEIDAEIVAALHIG